MSQKLTAQRLEIADVIIITPAKFGDERGFFSETYNQSALREFGIGAHFVQDNQSLSRHKGVVRGLHFQSPPHAQGKLVRVVRGRIFDVAVDIRRGSPTYGKHVATELSADNWRQLWLPAGFAHAFCTLEDDTEVIYKVTDYYAPQCDCGIQWNDPALGIDWPIAAGEAVLSAKDMKLPRLAEITSPFVYET
ncbi:MAG TPA: dTDP-4-dehydrorhamnose 3,5-epimerase [Hyphomicrobiaceae bacterium]|nr:dTDP-4-dehydrorhamnose 3,5-epimerase [Hyphomicrobiaceae bacterium]